MLAITAAGGMILGLGIGMLRDISDRVFRTSSRVESELKTACIAVVPDLKAQDPFQVVTASPFSRFAESIRSIKVAADLHGPVKSNKVIAITSSLPNEGKSTIAVALAQVISKEGARVLLVDCDLRNPTLTARIAPEANVGLLEVMSSKVLLEDAIWTHPSANMTFLPAVFKYPVAYTSALLASDLMEALFDGLRARYDYVVVDLSPLAPVADVRVMTRLVDSFIFVIEWGRTKIDVAEHALGAARGVYDRLLGVVLNKADFNALARYESHRGEYYTNGYYARYGQPKRDTTAPSTNAAAQKNRTLPNHIV